MKDDEIRSKLADLKLNLVHSNRNIIHEKVLAWSPCIIAEMETGTIIFASERVNQLFGYTFNAIEGLKVTDLMPVEFRKRHDQHLQNYSKNPTFRNMGSAHNQELKGFKKDGTEFSLKISLEPFYYEQKGYVLASIITV